MIEYRIYEDKDYSDLERITLNSFLLTAFHTDNNIPLEKANRIAWEMWCKPVLLSPKNKCCITACVNNKAIGYLIYGINSQWSKIIKQNIGTIILMAVDQEYRSKYQVAPDLLRYVLNTYKELKISIITVGTDLDNLPALISYINTGFKPVLTWTTFRRYYQQQKNISYPGLKIDQTKSINIKICERIHRPVSLFYDHNFSEEQKNNLNRFIKKKVKQEIVSGKLTGYQIKYKHKLVFYITLYHDKLISTILQKGFYRIHDLIILTEDRKLAMEVFNYFLPALKEYHTDLEILEIFSQLNNWPLLELLSRNSFIQIHNAITLHYHLVKKFTFPSPLS